MPFIQMLINNNLERIIFIWDNLYLKYKLPKSWSTIHTKIRPGKIYILDISPSSKHFLTHHKINSFSNFLQTRDLNILF